MALVSAMSPRPVEVAWALRYCDVLRVFLAVLEGHLDGVGRAAAVRGRGAEVIGIRADAVADEFGVDFRTAFFGVFEFLDDDDAGAFAHDEAVAVFIEGAGSAFGIVVAGAERLHVGETAEAHRQDGGFGTAADEAVGIAEFDDAPGLADVVVGGGAGGDDDHVRSREAEFHGNDAAGDVGDHHRDGERRNALRPLGHEGRVLAFEGGESADAAADHHAETAGIDGGNIESTICHGHFRGGDGELHVAIRAPGILGNAEIAVRIEVFHLTGDLAIEGLGIEIGDRCDPAATRFQALPCGGQIVAQGADTTNACDDYAALIHNFEGKFGGSSPPAQAS